ncbi:ATP-binding protein [Streptantibioticus rubrisoli]|uniref:ATP-binding protein n=1 Tax=Streptantibioticus rubrisoli TaxID=1387313 RepID=A0ABT1PLN7_9ACTN|nr:ATP-binding protein [Streptantibioticus rubrisoli]MCQ4045210.1 ATP-binding protein [Streptantibioticus rubrisoli]
MNDSPQPPCLGRHFYPRTRRSVPAAREFAQRALRDWNVASRVDDILLCVSELATNALLHGVPPGRGYQLSLGLSGDGVLRVEVHDSGDGEVRIPDTEAEDESGRGLRLVASLADKWGVGERRPGKIVWCEFMATTLSD